MTGLEQEGALPPSEPNPKETRWLEVPRASVKDSQWIQKLHEHGLLRASFRPAGKVVALRSYLRHRQRLIEYAASYVQHMQKALMQMNLQLHHVVSDITGVTGMTIIRAIVEGEHDPAVLAEFRDVRCKASVETIRESLTGHCRAENIFCLQQVLQLYDVYQAQIGDCDGMVESALQTCHWRRLERSRLGKSRTDDELARLSSALQVAAARDHTRFTNLHEKRAEVIEKLYSLIARTYKAAIRFVSPLEQTALPKEEKFRELRKVGNDLRAYFDDNEIYFTEGTCQRFERFYRALRLPAQRLYDESVDHGRGLPTAKNTTSAWREIEEHAPPLRQALKDEFREILGVPEARSD